MTSTKAALLAQIDALSPDKKLVLAGQLAAVPGKLDLAMSLAETAYMEHQAGRLMAGN